MTKLVTVGLRVYIVILDTGHQIRVLNLCIFFISQPKQRFCLLKRTVSMGRFFLAPKR